MPRLVPRHVPARPVGLALSMLLVGCGPAPDPGAAGGAPSTNGEDVTVDEGTPEEPAVACIFIRQSILEFGDVRIDEDADVTFVIDNPCDGALRIDRMEVEAHGGIRSDVTLTPRIARLAAGASTPVTMSVIASDFGSFFGQIWLESNDPYFPTEVVPFRGRVVCERSVVDVDSDLDQVPDACDVCPGGDDTVDTDFDTVPDDCDVCPGFDDTLDADGDSVPDGCDLD